MTRIPAPPFRLSGLNAGERLSFEADQVRFHYDVTDTEEDRALPLVRITASQVEEPGFPIVDRLNANPLRGVLLGSCDFSSAELDKEGLIVFGKGDGLAVEMSIDGEIAIGVFPAPSGMVEVV